MKKKTKQLFIISLPRSGSTLLQRILMAHSKIDSIAEPWVLLPFVYAAKPAGMMTTYSHHIASRGLSDLIGNLPNKEEDYYKFLAEFVEKMYATQVKAENGYFLDKTPKYYSILTEIDKIFPDAKYIFLFRNPVQIYGSFLSTWGNNSFTRLEKYRHYFDITEGPRILSEGYKLLRDKSIGIQYEEFVENPEKHTRELLDYLGLEYEEGLIADFSSQDLKGRNVDPKADKYKNIEKKSLETWKSIFNTRYRKSILKNYVEGFDEDTFSVQGYNKNSILKEIDELKPKGKYSLLRDIYDFNKVKFVSKYSRLSFN